jgi:hypothetical protein
MFPHRCRDSSVRGVLQSRMGLPGVGSCHSRVHLPSLFVLWILFPSTACTLCFTFPRICTVRFCRSQSRGTTQVDDAGVRHRPRCQPLYYRAGLLRHGSY